MSSDPRTHLPGDRRMAACALLAAIVVMFCLPPSAFGQAPPSAAAACALLALAVVAGDVRLVASRPVMFGGLSGISGGFLLRQSAEFPHLAQGAGRIALLASVVWLASWAITRWSRRRREVP